MADAFHEVVYRAVADFSAVVREAAKTRAELAALNRDIENFNRNTSNGVSRGVPGNTAQEIRTATQALKDQNTEFERHSTAVRNAGRDLDVFVDKSRTLLNKHTADLRAAGQEFQAFNDKYTQRGFDGLGEKALRNLNNVAGRMREVVREHQEELKRLTEGRDFKFDERPARVTQPGLFPEDSARGQRSMTGRVEHVVRDTAETKANTEAVNANTAAVLANDAAREKASRRRRPYETSADAAIPASRDRIEADLTHYDPEQRLSTGRMYLPGYAGDRDSDSDPYISKVHARHEPWRVSDLPGDVSEMQGRNLQELIERVARHYNIGGTAGIDDGREELPSNQRNLTGEFDLPPAAAERIGDRIGDRLVRRIDRDAKAAALARVVAEPVNPNLAILEQEARRRAEYQRESQGRRLEGEPGYEEYVRRHGAYGGHDPQGSVQGRALSLYQGAAYDVGNQLQRGGTLHGRAENASPDDVVLIREMNRLIHRSFERESGRLQEDLTVFRGQLSHPDRPLPTTPGALIRDRAFQSTSMDEDTARQFAQEDPYGGRQGWVRQLLEIQARRGQEGIALGNRQNEAEFLLRRGQYRVTGAQTDDEGLQRIQAEYLTDDEFEEAQRERTRAAGGRYQRFGRRNKQQTLTGSEERYRTAETAETEDSGFAPRLMQQLQRAAKIWALREPTARDGRGRLSGNAGYAQYLAQNPDQDPTQYDFDSPRGRAIFDYASNEESIGDIQRGETPRYVSGDDHLNRLHEDINALNEVFESNTATLRDNFTLFRGQQVDRADAYPTTPGSLIGDSRFQLTNADREAAEQQAYVGHAPDEGQVQQVLEILARRGQSAIPASGPGGSASEMLLQRGRYRVTGSRTDDDGVEHIQAELLTEEEFNRALQEQANVIADGLAESRDDDRDARRPAAGDDSSSGDYFRQLAAQNAALYEDEDRRRISRDAKIEALGRGTPDVDVDRGGDRGRFDADAFGHRVGELICEHLKKCFEDNVAPLLDRAGRDAAAEPAAGDHNRRQEFEDEELKHQRRSNRIERDTHRSLSGEAVSQAGARTEQEIYKALTAEEKLTEQTHKTASAQERLNQELHKTAALRERAEQAAANSLINEEKLNRAIHESAAARSRASVAAENAEQAAARTLIAEERVQQAVHGTETARNRERISQENLETATARTLTQEERLYQAVHGTEVARQRVLQASERTNQANTRTAITEENLNQAVTRTAVANERRLQAIGATEVAARRLEQIEERNRHLSATNANREQLLAEQVAAAARRREEAEQVAARREARSSRRPTTFREAISQTAERLIPYNQALVNRREVDRDVGLLGRVRNAFREVREARSAASGGGGSGSGIGGAFLGAAANLGENIGNSLGKASTRLITMRGLIVALIASLGPLIAALGALGAAAIGAGNALISMGGAVLALPGLIAAAAAGIGALIVAIKPVANVFQAYSAAQKAANKASSDSKDALKEERNAQQDLNDARRQAVRDLQDLQTAVSRASLDEEGAVLNLRRAEADYRKTLADPNSTLLDREEALHRVKVAENDLADVRLRNTRNAEDLAAAEKLGVDGSKSVQTALERLATAQKNAAAGSSAAATANAEYQRVLALLGPNARAVTLAILGQADAWKELQKYVGEQFFAPLVGQMGKLPTLLKTVRTLLGDAGGAVGEVAAKGLAMVTSGPWTADFQTISKQNVGIIRSLGDAALSVASAFRHITIAAGPFTQWVGAAIARVADNFDRWAKAGRESGSIADFLDTTRLRLQQMGQILGNVFSLFKSLFFASSDFTGDFMEALVKVTDRWAAFGKTTESNDSKFRKYLEDVKPLLRDLAGFLKAVAVAFVQIASDPANIEEASKLFKALNDVVLPGLVRFFTSLSRSDAISNIVEALGSLLEVVNAFLEAGGSTALEGFFGTLTIFIKAMQPILTFGPIAHIVGAIAIAFGALAAASVIGRFSGLFAIIGALRFLRDNRGNLTGALLDKLSGGAATTTRAGTQSAADLESGKLVGTYTGQLNTIIGLLQRIAACTCSDAGDDVDDLFGGGKKGKAASKVNLAKGAAGAGAGAAEAGAAGAAGGFFSRLFGRGAAGAGGAAAGAGRLASFGRIAGGAGALAGLGLSLAADNELFGGKGSAGKQFGQAGGAILGGAGTGALIGSFFPVIGTAIGAVIGALVGGIYSLVKDAGLRKRLKDGAVAVGGYIYEEILTPIGHFFSGIGSAILGFARHSLSTFVNSTIYQKLIRPVLAIVVGIQNAVVAAMKYSISLFSRAFAFVGGLIGTFRIAAIGWVKDHVSGPILRALRFIGTLFGAIRVAVLGWIDEHVTQKILAVFQYIDTLTAGVRIAVLGWINQHFALPILQAFQYVNTLIGAARIAMADFANTWLIQPVQKFFRFIGDFFINLPTIVEQLLEKIPGVGPYIAKAYRDLGIGTEISGAARRLKYSGGLVEGPRDGRVDTIDARLTAGEFITRRRIVDKPYVKQLLDDLNNDRFDPAQFYAGLNSMSLSSVPSASMNRMVISPQSMTVSTVNNHGKGALHIGDVTINNPVREKSDRSLRRTLQNAAYLHNR